MGTTNTHYVMFGILIQNKDEVEQFFLEDHYDLLNQYEDNGYKEEITPTPSGFHVIADGMNCEYVVVGKILQKGLQHIEFTRIPGWYKPGNPGEFITFPFNDAALEQQFYEFLSKLEQQLNINFADKKFEFIVFTHWH